MKFDNEPTIYGIHTVKLLLAVMVVIFVVLMLITPLPAFVERTTGLTTGVAVGIVVGAYFLFFAYFILKGSAFVSYNDEGEKIIIRTFKLGPFTSQRLSLEIAKSDLYQLSVVRRGLREELHLYTRRGDRVAKYPPISIVSLTGAQKRMLLDTLAALAQAK